MRNLPQRNSCKQKINGICKQPTYLCQRATNSPRCDNHKALHHDTAYHPGVLHRCHDAPHRDTAYRRDVPHHCHGAPHRNTPCHEYGLGSHAADDVPHATDNRDREEGPRAGGAQHAGPTGTPRRSHASEVGRVAEQGSRCNVGGDEGRVLGAVQGKGRTRR